MHKALLLITFIFWGMNGFALYLGNPASPDMVEKGLFIAEDAFLDFKIGYQVDFIFDKRLKSYAGARSRVDTFEGQLTQGVFTVNCVDRIEGYASVGSMESCFSHRPRPQHFIREYQTNYRVTWGVGGRILVYEWGNSFLGIEGGYQWAYPHIKWDALNGTSFTTDATMRYREWQIGVGFAHRIEMLIPYLAVKYSNVQAKLSSLRHNLALSHSHFKMRNRDHFGLVLGCTLTTGKWFDANIESRMIDEQAVSLAGNLKF
jgi:hypothetical protein